MKHRNYNIYSFVPTIVLLVAYVICMLDEQIYRLFLLNYIRPNQIKDIEYWLMTNGNMVNDVNTLNLLFTISKSLKIFKNNQITCIMLKIEV